MGQNLQNKVLFWCGSCHEAVLKWLNWDIDYPLRWICSAIYINEHLNATDHFGWLNMNE